MDFRIRAIQNTLANCKANSEKNISNTSNSPTNIPQQIISAEIARSNLLNDNNQRQDTSRPIIVANSTSNGIVGQQGKNLNLQQ